MPKKYIPQISYVFFSDAESSSNRILIINSKLSRSDHLASCTSSIHALRMLRNHGLRGQQMHVVATMTTLASLIYASPSGWGYTSANDRDRIDKLISRSKRGGYLPPGNPSFVELAEKADKRF